MLEFETISTILFDTLYDCFSNSIDSNSGKDIHICRNKINCAFMYKLTIFNTIIIENFNKFIKNIF